jgi:hypothetical protein
MAIQPRPRHLFETGVLNGVIFAKRPVINDKKPPESGCGPRWRNNWGKEGFAMLRLLRILFILAVLAGTAVVGYAYLGDLSPEQTDVSEPVTLDGN